jgi:tRNA A37 methylthiotransferase MiaB
VDSERILTQLRTEGYDDAELVIVNTCGFIDSAVQESLDTIGEALLVVKQPLNLKFSIILNIVTIKCTDNMDMCKPHLKVLT